MTFFKNFITKVGHYFPTTVLKKAGGALLRAGALIKDNTVKHYPPYYHAITMNHNNQNLP